MITDAFHCENQHKALVSAGVVKADDAHPNGRAVHIQAEQGDPVTRFKVIEGCYAAGFMIFDLNKNYLHVEDDPKHLAMRFFYGDQEEKQSKKAKETP